MRRRLAIVALSARRRKGLAFRAGGPAPALQKAEQSRQRRPVRPSLPPAEAEHPATAAARIMARPPDRLWRYVTAAGETAFFIARWNNPAGRKTVRTLSWDVLEGWRIAAWPGGRPLFNLSAIRAQPQAPVVVCEGEPATEIAAAIFPDFVATTSSGGASAAARTDWTPLAGRAVLVWPDHDEAGRAFAREVAMRLVSLGCAVRILDPPTLAASRMGGSPAPPPKWDAADAARAWPSLADLRAAALAATRPFFGFGDA